MFSHMVKNLNCDVCDTGRLTFHREETMKAWKQPEIFRLDDVGKLQDGVISELLVFVCEGCGAQVRLTLKELDKKFRKQLTRRMLTDISTGNEPDPGAVRKTDRLFVYCGKCGGYDGKGSCTKYIYDKCDLRRMPHGF